MPSLVVAHASPAHGPVLLQSLVVNAFGKYYSWEAAWPYLVGHVWWIGAR